MLQLLLLIAAGPEVRAYSETVRYDDDRLLIAARKGGPEVGSYQLTPPLRFHAAKDEVIAFQLQVKGRGTHVVSTSTSPLRVTTYAVKSVGVPAPSTGPGVYSLGAGRYPDILVPTATVSAPGWLWVDIHVPRDAATGSVALSLDVGGTKVALQVEVLDIVMPLQDVAHLGAVNFGSILMRGKTDRQRELAWMQMAHAHYLSIEMLRPHPRRLADGGLDWEGWAEHIGPYVDGTAFTPHYGYQGPRRGEPTSRFILPHTDWWPVPKTKDHLPSDPAAFSKSLAEWEKFAASKGWFAHPHPTEWVLFVNSLDEPREPELIASLAAYQKLIDDAGLQDRSRVLFRVDGNFGQKIEGYDDEKMAQTLGGVVDIWNVHGAPYTIPWKLLERRRKMYGEKITAYFSNTSGEPSLPPTVVDAPVTALRAWGWLVARYRLDGLMNWEVDFEAGCVENTRCSPGGLMNLDATLIYRGHEIGERFDEPYPSIRLKVLRRGAQDAALLSLLAQRDPKTAQQLAEVIVPLALGDDVPPTGYGVWPQDPLTYERARYAILDRLVGNQQPMPLQKVRFDRPDQFKGKGKMISFRVAIYIGVILLWLGFMWYRKKR